MSALSWHATGGTASNPVVISTLLASRLQRPACDGPDRTTPDVDGIMRFMSLMSPAVHPFASPCSGRYCGAGTCAARHAFVPGAAQAFEDAAVLASCLAEAQADPAQALRRYESERISRASEVQRGSYARADYNHLPDGPEQRTRDEALRGADPLAANAWIYAHDPFSPN
jgi:2-polyprenyl-6-methoxyphenol hydroxylase-like FAD-dependent oxidoreductase